MTNVNGVMMQYFHWDTPDDGSLWREVAANASALRAQGFTALWLPPFGKGAAGIDDVGYAGYDLFDLGEFNQKNTIRTKYGTKEELLQAIEAAHTAGLHVYADVVFNHKDGADETEVVQVQEVDWNDRNVTLSGWFPIHAWTKFTFPGRAGKHSTMTWDWRCFDALSYNADTQNANKLYRLKSKQFSTEVSHEHGNFDYLMADDLDTSNPAVEGELKYWGEWLLGTTGVDGFRLDACKHIRYSFFPEWLGHLRSTVHQELFSVGEYWSGDVNDLHAYLTETGGTTSLFDVPLHYHFEAASKQGNGFDMRTILDGTLMQQQPTLAVTFVENHDTQPCQSLASPVDGWFKPLAYALILLRAEGYPCVFYGDYYGAEYKNCVTDSPRVSLTSHRASIDAFLKARNEYGFGDQHDYFDHPNTIGWVRTGDVMHPGAMAVVMTNGSEGFKRMQTFKPGASFSDVTRNYPQKITTDADGWGLFPCAAGNVSVWVQD